MSPGRVNGRLYIHMVDAVAAVLRLASEHRLVRTEHLTSKEAFFQNIPSKGPAPEPSE